MLINVAEDRRPIGVRVIRPYANEDEFLERELETIHRTGALLVGAQRRPNGGVLRFEVALQDGTPLLRGEARVIGYHERALGDQPGLALRFVRLDSRSKVIVDKAVALRDARREAFGYSIRPSQPSIPVPSPSATEHLSDPTLIPISSGPAEIPAIPSSANSLVDASGDRISAATLDAIPITIEEPEDEADMTMVGISLFQDPIATTPTLESDADAERAAPSPYPPMVMEMSPHPAPAEKRAPVFAASDAKAVVAPENREELLEKLRARGRSLSEARIAEILNP